MKNCGQTIAYNAKYLIYYLPFTLIPACFIGGMTQPFRLTSFLFNLPKLVVNNFKDVFDSMFAFSWSNLLYGVLGFLLCIMLFSFMFGVIDKHFKTGKITYSDGSSYINNNILIIFIYSLIFLLIWFISLLITSLVAFVLHIIICGIGTLPSVLCIVLTYIISIAIFLVIVYFVSIIFLSIPETMNTGYSLRTCVLNMSNMLSGKMKGIYISFLIPLIFVPILAISINTWFEHIAVILMLELLSCYYITLCNVVYFNIYSLNRADLQSTRISFKRR